MKPKKKKNMCSILNKTNRSNNKKHCLPFSYSWKLSYIYEIGVQRSWINSMWMSVYET